MCSRLKRSGEIAGGVHRSPEAYTEIVGNTHIPVFPPQTRTRVRTERLISVRNVEINSDGVEPARELRVLTTTIKEIDEAFYPRKGLQATDSQVYRSERMRAKLAGLISIRESSSKSDADVLLL